MSVKTDTDTKRAAADAVRLLVSVVVVLACCLSVPIIRWDTTGSRSPTPTRPESVTVIVVAEVVLMAPAKAPAGRVALLEPNDPVSTRPRSFAEKDALEVL